jgi:hypothetical protein
VAEAVFDGFLLDDIRAKPSALRDNYLRAKSRCRYPAGRGQRPSRPSSITPGLPTGPSIEAATLITTSRLRAPTSGPQRSAGSRPPIWNRPSLAYASEGLGNRCD